MNNSKKWIAFLVVGIMLVSPLTIVSFADSNSEQLNIITINFSFEKPKLSSITIDDKQFTRASIAGLSNSENAGAPALPKKTARILLPPKSSVVSIDVEKNGKRIISNVKNIELGSLSYYPLSIPDAEVSSVIKEDGVVTCYIDKSGTHEIDKYTPQYDTTRMYPEKLFISSGVQYKRGLPVLMVDLYPTQYDASSQTLIYYTDLTLKVKTEKDDSVGFDSLYRGLSSDFAVVSDLVDNPDMIGSYKNQGSGSMSAASDDDGGNMLIITTEKLKSYSGTYDLSKLVQAHKNNGMNNVYIETVESIDQHYSFDPTKDLWGPAKGKNFVSTQPLAYKIRKCVKDYYLNQGVDYVLLVGDDDYEWEEGVTVPLVAGPLARYKNIKDGTEVPTFQVFMGTIKAWVYIIDGGSNERPVANVGGPYSGKVDEPITFDASASYDKDGKIVKYEWKYFSGDSWHSTGGSPYSSHTYHRNPDGTYFASHTLTLRVTDNNGSIDTDTTTVSLSSNGGNLPPIANVGGPYSGKSGKSITFDASRSYDPDGSIVKYEWKFSSDGSGNDNDDSESNAESGQAQEGQTNLLSPTSEVPSTSYWISSGSSPRISHTFSSKGSYTVTVRVTDDDGAKDTDSSSISVKTGITDINKPPVAKAGGPYSGKSGKSITFDASRSYDPDGSIVKYEWKFSSDGNNGGNTDAGSNGDVTQEQDNLCLSSTSDSSPDSAHSGGSIPSSSKGTWHSSGSSPRISHTFSSEGSHTVTVRVTDDDGATDVGSAVVKVWRDDDGDNDDGNDNVDHSDPSTPSTPSTPTSPHVDSSPSQQKTDKTIDETKNSPDAGSTNDGVVVKDSYTSKDAASDGSKDLSNGKGCDSEMSNDVKMQMSSDSTEIANEEPYYKIDDIDDILTSDQPEASGDGSGGGSGGNSNPPPGHWEHIFTRHVTTASDLPYSCLDNSGYLDDIMTYSKDYKGPKFFPDLLSEVYVGRAPVSDVSDLQNFVKKTVSYMNAPASEYNKVLNVGEHLGFGGVAEYAADMLNELINGCKHNGYKTVGIPSADSSDSTSSGMKYIIERLYEKIRGWGGNTLIDTINSGNVNIVNHLGHANVDFNMKLGTPGYQKHGARPTSGFKNTQYPIIYSQGCYAGAYDSGEISHSLFKEVFGSWLGGPYKYSNGEKMYHDSIAEYLTVKNPNGAVAGIWNSHFGWGRRASTDGPSQRYHREFIDAIFGEGKSTLGWANQDSKEDNLVRLDSWPMLWLYYCINLLGDPALKVKGAPYNPPELDQDSGDDGGDGSDDNGGNDNNIPPDQSDDDTRLDPGSGSGDNTTSDIDSQPDDSNNVGSDESSQNSESNISLNILTPSEGKLYILGKEIVDFPRTLIIGPINIQAEVNDTNGTITRVEFYIDGDLRYNTTEGPYSYDWNEKVFGLRTITVKAYDDNGYSEKTEFNVLIFNFGFNLSG